MWPKRTRPQTHLARQASESTSLSWRLRSLVRAGVEPTLARSLAADPSMDLHAFIELLEHGCPARLAARILAPLEGDEKGPGR